MLLNEFLSLDTPPGYRAELIDQEIVVTPPPIGTHEGIIDDILRAVYRELPERFGISGNRGLITPRGRFVPDITVAARSILRIPQSWIPTAGIELVCEVTSGKAHRDRESKRPGYAQAEIPLYLLVDRAHQESVLFSEPDEADYRTGHTVPFGKDLTLPKPFEITINTKDFE